MPHLRARSSSRNPSSSRMTAPPHPFPELQGPFEESMQELERLDENEVPADAASRRTILLDAPTYERVIAGRWKQRPGEKYHPLWKIVAQLSFGIHLLAENLAKSEEEVMQILQGHVDEIDVFLERTTEDLSLAQDDIQERMRCLQLPLQHPKVFDRMLEDRAFRNSIVDGNEKIEHIVARTSFAMKDSLKDAQKGLDATASLEQYLSSLEDSWGRRSPEHEAVFDAMLENVEGWRSAFVDLHSQGDTLGKMLKELSDVINQMQQRAGEVSRRLIRAQQKQGPSPTSSHNATYAPRQTTPSSAGPRAETPSQAPRKPLPGVPHRESGRLSANAGLRCDTAQSNRSVNSQRMSDVNKSRASSREGMSASARDSNQVRLSAKSPRLIEIKRHSPQAREVFHTAPIHQSQNSRSERSISQPVGLAVELPTTQGRAASMPTANGANTGLGIIQGEEVIQSASKTRSPTSTPVGVSYDQNNASVLPLTPSSMNSNKDASQVQAHELPSESVPRSETTLTIVTSQPAAQSSLGSPPSTPAWAKQTFDNVERDRLVTSKTAFRSHPPNADLGSPPVILPNGMQQYAQHARVNGSIASSLGAPGPEIASSITSSPVKAGNVNTNGPNVSLTGFAPTSIVSNGLLSAIPHDGKKAFVAELEGTTPILLQPAVYGRDTSRSVPETHLAAELEAPLLIQREPAPSQDIEVSELAAEPMVSELDAQQDGQYDFANVSSSDPAQDQADMIEHKMAAAIRKSFIATNIELPGSLFDSLGPITTKDVIEDSQARSPEESSGGLSREVDDILAQLEQFSTASPNLSLKGEEVLFTLPATTYVADRAPPVRAQAPPSLQESMTKVANANLTIDTGSKAGNGSSKPGISTRNSAESTASSQSQWRAFFKGQLSPADFNSSTPHLPSKVNSAHKTIIELKRRGQEASPTLGWQWAPDSPEIDRRSMRKVA